MNEGTPQSVHTRYILHAKEAEQNWRFGYTHPSSASSSPRVENEGSGGEGTCLKWSIERRREWRRAGALLLAYAHGAATDHGQVSNRMSNYYPVKSGFFWWCNDMWDMRVARTSWISPSDLPGSRWQVKLFVPHDWSWKLYCAIWYNYKKRSASWFTIITRVKRPLHVTDSGCIY